MLAMSQGVTLLTKTASKTWLMTWQAVFTRHYSEVFAAILRYIYTGSSDTSAEEEEQLTVGLPRILC